MPCTWHHVSSAQFRATHTSQPLHCGMSLLSAFEDAPLQISKKESHPTQVHVHTPLLTHTHAEVASAFASLLHLLVQPVYLPSYTHAQVAEEVESQLQKYKAAVDEINANTGGDHGPDSNGQYTGGFWRVCVCGGGEREGRGVLVRVWCAQGERLRA